MNVVGNVTRNYTAKLDDDGILVMEPRKMVSGGNMGNDTVFHFPPPLKTVGHPSFLKKTHYELTAETIGQIPFDTFRVGIENAHPDCSDFYSPCGKEHYRLLAYLSSLFNNSTIIDIGTHRGSSAIALSYNSTNVVHTFDIDKHYIPMMDGIENIHFHTDNLFDRATFMKWVPTILTCPFIFVDVDPHNGDMEMGLYGLLQEINYQGFVVWDDIYYFKDMRNKFWYNIPEEVKYDLTLVGHFSGTGVTTFNSNITFHKNDTSKWTLVTAYYDLTRFNDAKTDTFLKPANYYMDHARATMSSPYNLIVYCEKQHLEELKQLRPEHLQRRTMYRIVDFDEFYFRKGHNSEENKHPSFNFSKYREIIKHHRRNNPLYNKDKDNRDTPSYYLLCMSRYIMLKETIDRNPFGSTHFAWINICIERMGFSNLVHLDEALSVYRDRFSTCYIDYIPEKLVLNLPEYFLWGRCSMCSGFFTGNSHYMWTVADLFEDQFIEYFQKGYGHTDEQLYSPVYFKHPELFEHYYGDYVQMITNYAYIYEAPQTPIFHFIRNSFDFQNYEKCHECCQFIWKSFLKKKCELPFQENAWLCYYYMMSKKNMEEKNKVL